MAHLGRPGAPLNETSTWTFHFPANLQVIIFAIEEGASSADGAVATADAVCGVYGSTPISDTPAATAMAVVCVPLISTLGRSPPYMAPPPVAECLSDTHLFASGPSELAGIVGWLTGGDGTSTRRNTKAMIIQDRDNTVAPSHGAAWTLKCSTRFNLGDRHWQWCVHLSL